MFSFMGSPKRRAVVRFRKSYLKAGFLFQRSTSAESIRNLLQRIVPMSSNYELMRVGGPNDGGYLIPNDISGIRFLFSPGVGESVEFEKELFAKFGIMSHLIDASVTKPQEDCIASFEPKFIGPISDGDFLSLEDWISSKHDSKDDLILSMDIEGAEYEALLNCNLKTLKKFRVIVLEFHDVELWSQPAFFRLVSVIFDKLLNSFYVAHIHVNNCCGLFQISGVELPRVFEITFHRRNRVHNLVSKSEVYSPLDSPTVQSLDELNWNLLGQF